MNKSDFNSFECKTYPPHEYIGENLSFLLSEIYSSSHVLKDFLQESNKVLNKYSDPKLRYYFYPWGISQKTELPSFEKLHYKKAAAVCAAEIAMGIAIALDMHVPKLRDATADTDTNLAEKAKVTSEMLNEYDFVLVHINGADEAAHRRDYKQKTKFIENIDKIFFSYLLEHIDCKTKIMICGDHSTSSLSGKHTKNPVPFIIGEVHGIKSSITLNNDLSVKEAFNYLLEE
jgi:2,3-bisphosphoglycerate-independent phosphoglycerate mutase